MLSGLKIGLEWNCSRSVPGIHAVCWVAKVKGLTRLHLIRIGVCDTLATRSDAGK
jgi:hypothetical protein